MWELSKFKLRTNHYGHTGYINTISVSPDGSLAASGGKDGITMLWDLNEAKHLYSLEAGDVVNALVFSPNRYWLCAATASCIKIFDLESKYVELQSRNPMVMLMFAMFSDRSSMSSSQNVPTLARSRSQYVCQSPGQQMARHCSVVSPMTLSVSGALFRNYIVGLVVYYMTCCTLKIDHCCIHVRSFIALGNAGDV